MKINTICHDSSAQCRNIFHRKALKYGAFWFWRCSQVLPARYGSTMHYFMKPFVVKDPHLAQTTVTIIGDTVVTSGRFRNYDNEDFAPGPQGLTPPRIEAAAAREK